VQTDADLRREWLLDADAVGLTAGTSTPDDVIERVEARIREMDDERVHATAAVAGSVR
jgi:4-hydroxy-3-methylbut-2-enyl diphosphate reductase IspH